MAETVELDEKYEYRSVVELEGISANFIRIPSSIILDTELSNKRVAVFVFLSIYKGLNSRLFFSIPNLLEWAGYKNDTHKGGINDKFLDAMEGINDRGYLTYYGELTRTSCIEIEFDRQKVFNECSCSSFAILYLDEVERIMRYKNSNSKDVYLNNVSVLLVFAFLRNAIFRTPNKLKIEEQSQEGIKARKDRCVEAYANTYKEIGELIGLSERTVSKAVKVLESLKLIVVDEAYHIRNKEGEFRTPYTLFANMEKREGKYLLTSGLEYARGEMERKAEKIRFFETNYNINTKLRGRYFYN